MSRLGGLVPVILVLGQAGSAAASAWTLPKGQGQAILKYEDMRADKGFDPSGRTVSLPAPRRDQGLSLFTEYGITDRLTLQVKAEWQAGRDAWIDYEGRGPIEVGARWQVYSGSGSSVSVYGGYAHGGSGRNAGYAAPGQGEEDWELRVLAGQSYRTLFVDAQLARRWREGLLDETRVDLTLGARLSPNWVIMSQAFAGRTDPGRDDVRTAWLAVEGSVVRHSGNWSGQIGWRATAAGKETPLSHGPVLALWRRF